MRQRLNRFRGSQACQFFHQRSKVGNKGPATSRVVGLIQESKHPSLHRRQAQSRCKGCKVDCPEPQSSSDGKLLFIRQLYPMIPLNASSQLHRYACDSTSMLALIIVPYHQQVYLQTTGPNDHLVRPSHLLRCYLQLLPSILVACQDQTAILDDR